MAMENELAAYYFHQGTNYRAYEFLGCNMSRIGKKYLYTFRLWAPNALSVSLISDFTGWDTPVAMERVTENGVWAFEYLTSAPIEKQAYKFRITSAKGGVNKGDPYARFSRGLDDGASLVYTRSSHKWSDSRWLKYRKRTYGTSGDNYLGCPLNIYEVHAGSFMRKEDGQPLSYRELADVLAPYVKAMGYTHVELLPIMEHPYDASWGYQVCAFYAPTSRFGDPDDFRYFVDKLHSVGIGVILDWVPAHFPKDEWGLFEFDGQPLYEYQGIDRQESSSWGTRFFDLGREEVQSFLVSNALYYLREFHIDGLRVDAVASMLYLDYDRAPGEWIPAEDGSNISPEGTAFFKKLNTAVFSEFGDVLMIAEESGDHGNITRPVHDGGLGFNLKWNMGWANDFYAYLSSEPVHRSANHKALNFPLMYAFSENYCLPISHDEVVHGKRSFIDKISGEYEDKFRQMRSALLLMMTYPGKKLTFMGTEYAQFREWDYSSSLEWFMLEYDSHRGMRDYVRALNLFYLSSPELWSLDFESSGFSWVLPDEADKNSVVYYRHSGPDSSLLVAISFSGVPQTLRIPIPDDAEKLEAVFASEPHLGAECSEIIEDGGQRYAHIKLDRFGGVIFKIQNFKKKIRV